MPSPRPFRALRYAPALGPDVSAVVCPPYDVIGAPQAAALRERDPYNAVRLELPGPEPGADPDSRYRAAARTLAEWRTAGILVKERQSSIYVHEMAWDGARGRTAGRARGVYLRMRLEPFGPGSGIQPHERTMTGPKEDRYQLLRATGVNLSPVVLLSDGAPGVASGLLDAMTMGSPDMVATTDDGVAHRVWTHPVPIDEDGAWSGDAQPYAELIEAGKLTIADGHHRYETALRYREERGRNRACESNPAWDYVLALVYDVAEAPPVLPTHRVLLSGPSGAALVDAFGELVEVQPTDDAEALLTTMARPEPTSDPAATGSGRIGLVSRDVAAVLRIRPEVVAPLQEAAASGASRGLDVNRLAIMLERVGVDAAALSAGDRIAYVKDAREAVAQATQGAAAAFLLDAPPVSAVTRVAAAGEVMPQKSTFFDPKAPTGLVFGPLEW